MFENFKIVQSLQNHWEEMSWNESADQVEQNEVLLKMAQTLNIDKILDKLSLMLCFELLDKGVNPQDLARSILALRREIGR